MSQDLFIPPPGAVQIAVGVNWKDHRIAVPEYPVWVMPMDEICPQGKRGFRVIDPSFADGSGWLCECHARIIE